MDSHGVRAQYERFPYPPVPSVALPQRGQGDALRFERWSGRASDGIRILVVGCGTLEALVAAQAHPRAKEVVALDFSESSLQILHRRLLVSTLARPFLKRARVRAICEDATRFEPAERFDYILASNMIHHVAEPEKLLARMSGWLADDGLLRVVTYPRASRIWMRETALWFKLNGLTTHTPELRSRCLHALARLPDPHPIRSCFRSHPETSRVEGLIDAFFHVLENPLSPSEWKHAADGAGLDLIAEGQSPSSRSDFLAEIFPPANLLNCWERLEILDRLLELCANPIFIFRKTGSGVPKTSHEPPPGRGFLEVSTGAIRLPSEPRTELAENLDVVAAILKPHGLELSELLRALRQKVGARTLADLRTPLPLLSIGEYEAATGPRPLWPMQQGLQLLYEGEAAPGETLADQASWWQRIHGPLMNEIPLELRNIRE